MKQTHPPDPDLPKAGQESVWGYPRPAIVEPSRRHIKIEHRGVVIANTRSAWRTLETSHPPTYYVPPADVLTEYLRPNPRRSLCEWKGMARYWDLVISEQRIEGVAWSYASPTASFADIRDYFAFYPDPLDACCVDGEVVTPQPGKFYGGWITGHESGPFKGVPGSQFW